MLYYNETRPGPPPKVMPMPPFRPRSLLDRIGAFGSLLCAAANSLGFLIFARVVQGLGGALMLPVGRLVVLRAYPRTELVRIMSFITIPGLLGPLLGPTVGGWLVEILSWHWIFLLNLPVGLNFLLAGYVHTAGDVAVDPSLPIADAELTVHAGALAYVRSLDLWGRSGKLDVLLPYASVVGTAIFRGQERERQVDGFADPRARLSVNLYGAPALSLEEFAAYRQDLIVGASFAVSDANSLTGVGRNMFALALAALGLASLSQRSPGSRFRSASTCTAANHSPRT